MMRTFIRLFIFTILALNLIACMHVRPTGVPSPATVSEVNQGQRLFESGYYKKAMRDLLPLACDGNAESQYAVGYMYYYGYGVAQDTDVGYFWINRSAENGYAPAKQALIMIANEGKNKKPLDSSDKLR